MNAIYKIHNKLLFIIIFIITILLSHHYASGILEKIQHIVARTCGYLRNRICRFRNKFLPQKYIK